MDEYAEFVEANLREADPAMIKRQKELEERIQAPFRIPDDTPDPAPRRSLASQEADARRRE